MLLKLWQTNGSVDNRRCFFGVELAKFVSAMYFNYKFNLLETTKSPNIIIKKKLALTLGEQKDALYNDDLFLYFNNFLVGNGMYLIPTR